MRKNHTQAIMKLDSIVETIVDLYYEIDDENKSIQLEIVEYNKEPSFFDITRDFEEFMEDLEAEDLDIIDDANILANGDYNRIDSDSNVIFESDIKEFYQIMDFFILNEMLNYHLVDLTNLETEIMDATVLTDVATFEMFLEGQINKNVVIKSVVARGNRTKTCAVTTLHEGEYELIKTEKYCIFVSSR